GDGNQERRRCARLSEVSRRDRRRSARRAARTLTRAETAAREASRPGRLGAVASVRCGAEELPCVVTPFICDRYRLAALFGDWRDFLIERIDRPRAAILNQVPKQSSREGFWEIDRRRAVRKCSLRFWT